MHLLRADTAHQYKIRHRQITNHTKLVQKQLKVCYTFPFGLAAIMGGRFRDKCNRTTIAVGDEVLFNCTVIFCSLPWPWPISCKYTEQCAEQHVEHSARSSHACLLPQAVSTTSCSNTAKVVGMGRMFAPEDGFANAGQEKSVDTGKHTYR